MRPALLIIVVIFCLSLRSTVAQDTSPNHEPSLKETTDWLSQNLIQVRHQQLETHIRFKPKKNPPKEISRRSSRISETIEAAKFDHCELILTDRYINGDGDDGTLVRVTVYRISLGRLTSVSIKSSTNDPITDDDGSHTTTTTPISENDLWLEAKTDNSIGSDLYDNVDSSDGSVSKIGRHRQISSVFFPIDDTQLAPRLIKALNHAIQLCHADTKPEPF